VEYNTKQICASAVKINEKSIRLTDVLYGFYGKKKKISLKKRKNSVLFHTVVVAMVGITTCAVKAFYILTTCEVYDYAR